MVLRVRMDFFQHRYYRVLKLLMTIIGQWPYQSMRTSQSFLAVMLAICISLLIPMTIAAIKHLDDRDTLMECVAGLGYAAGAALRLITFMWHWEKILKLLNRIRADWLVWAQEREVSILHEYAEQGRTFSIVYTGKNLSRGRYWSPIGEIRTPSMYHFHSNLLLPGHSLCLIGKKTMNVSMLRAVVINAIGIAYVTQPIVPKVIDVMLNNGSKPGQFPIPVYYYHLDEQKYYFFIIAHTYACITTVLTIMLAYDIVLFIYVQHACAIFAAVGQKLEQIGKVNQDREDEAADHVIFTCIARHNDAIEYAELIQSTFSWTFFITAVARIAIMSMTGLQIVTRIDEFQVVLKFIAFAIGLILYVYMESCIAEALMDHSISIRYYIQNSQWYNLPIKAQKLLLMMIMRSNVPCQLKAGPIFDMSVNSFVVFLKTSLSYLTVLRSI